MFQNGCHFFDFGFPKLKICKFQICKLQIDTFGETNFGRATLIWTVLALWNLLFLKPPLSYRYLTSGPPWLERVGSVFSCEFGVNVLNKHSGRIIKSRVTSVVIPSISLFPQYNVCPVMVKRILLMNFWNLRDTTTGFWCSATLCHLCTSSERRSQHAHRWRSIALHRHPVVVLLRFQKFI